MGKGCRFKEILGDSNVEHRVTAFWELKRLCREGGVGDVVQWVEYALWERGRAVCQVKAQRCRTTEGGPSQVRMRKISESHSRRKKQ